MPTVSIMRDMFSNLNSHENIQTTFMYLTDVRSYDIDVNDVIILMRPNNPYSCKIAYEARKAGHLVVTFCDDDLLNLPKNSPMIPWRKKGLIRSLAQSDVIWSSSRYIVEKYRNLTSANRGVVGDTILRMEEFEGVEAPCNEEVKIVYAAAPSHKDLFEKYILPIVPKLVKEFRVKFTFVSVHPEMPGIEHEYVSGMPLWEYRRYMKENHFDIGLAPLYKDEFTKCKYFNKFIEYTMQGIVGVYSNTEPYTYVVKDGENGFLADDNPEDWYRALKTAIQDFAKRKKCVESAIVYLKTNHSEKACIDRLIEEVPEFANALGNYLKCKSFGIEKYRYYFFRPLDWIYLTAFYLKHNGFRAVINRTRTHMIESKAYRKKHNS